MLYYRTCERQSDKYKYCSQIKSWEDYNMKKSLISKLLVGALLVTSILPLAGSTSVYAADTKENG